jgi:hypothetical protein
MGLLDHGRQRLLGGTPRLEEGREVAALPELGDLQVRPFPRACPGALAAAIAMV